MYCKEKGLTVKTCAADFENCMSVFFDFDETFYGCSYCETLFCPGIGIVKQSVVGRHGLRVWELKSYRINGGKGLLPFAKGNRWDYTCDGEEGLNYAVQNSFEVISVTEDTAILKKYSISEF